MPISKIQHCYDLFGQVIDTRIDLDDFLQCSDLEPSLLIKQAPFACSNQAVKLDRIYPQQPDKDTGLSIYTGDGFKRLIIDKLAIFDLYPAEIIVYPSVSADAELLAVKLLGPVLSSWLEFKGLPVLHASAIIEDDGVVIFMGHSGAGKTTLLSAMLLAGHYFFSDDLVPISISQGKVRVYPGWPFMRVRDDQIKRLGLNPVDYPLAPGTKQKRILRVDKNKIHSSFQCSAPVKKLYYLEKDLSQSKSDCINFELLNASAALIALMQCSYAAAMLDESGLQAVRIKKLTKFVEDVPIIKAKIPAEISDYKNISRIMEKDLIG